MFVPFARTCRLPARAFSALAAACLCVAASAFAQNTIHVPADQPTIQAGINAASPGDTVLVAPGTYYENIDFKGKAITVSGDPTQPLQNLIVDGRGLAPVVTFQLGEQRNSVLTHLTIRNGGASAGSYNGAAGVGIYGAGPSLIGNFIVQNACLGVDVSFGSALIQGNDISLNTTGGGSGGCDFGGAITLRGNGGTGGNTHSVILGNSIRYNTVPLAAAGAVTVYAAEGTVIQGNTIFGNSGATAGAIWEVNTDSISILNNLIYNNTVTTLSFDTGGGLALLPPGESVGPFQGIIAGNTIVNNHAPAPYGDSPSPTEVMIEGNLAQYVLVNNIIVSSSATQPALACGPVYNYLAITPPVFDHNDVYNASGGPAYGGACTSASDPNRFYGNISADPSFSSVASPYHPQAGSPVLDAGNNSAPLLPATDNDNNPRLQDATGLGYPVVDMGVYEYGGGTAATILTTLTLTPSTFTPFSAFGAGNGTFTLTAKLTNSDGPVPQGPVTFYEDANPVGTLAVDSTGAATLTPAVPTPGLHAFLAKYPGQGTAHAATSVKFYVLFPKYTTSLKLTSSSNPSPFGASIRFTVTVTSADNTVPSPITLTDTTTNTTLATLTPNSAGVATYDTSSLAVGYHYLSATYAGDATHNSASATLSEQIINPYATGTILSCTPSPSVFGGTVNLTATVTSSGGGAPAGTVSFSYGGTALGSAGLNAAGTNSATATSSTIALPVGYDTVNATYTPTGSFGTSSGTCTQQVLSGYPTITTLKSSPNPSKLGQSVTFSVHVAAQAAGNGIPTGSVTLAEGSSVLSTQPLDASGNAIYATATLTANLHNITATYVPTGSFAGSTASVQQVVNGLPVAAVIASNPAGSVSYGATDILTITLTFASGGPTIGGSVNVLIDGVVVGIEAVTPTSATSATSSYGTSTLPAGPHTFSCSYSGDSSYATATCASVPFTVTAASTALSLTSSGNPSPALSTAVLSATLTTSGAPFINAPVVITIDGKAVTVATNGAGVAIVNATLPAGLHAITAAYAGDSAHNPATASLTQTAVANPTTIAIVAAPNPASQNQPVSIAAVVHATTGTAAPYGTVVLLDGGTPIATLTIPASPTSSPTASVNFTVSTLAAATHTLSATYTPADANFTGSASAFLSVVITPADAVLSTDNPTLTVQTEHHKSLNLQLTSIGGLTGTFTLSCGSLPAWAHCYFGQSPILLAPGGTAIAVTTSGTFTTATTLEIDTDAVYHFKSALQRPSLPGQTPASRLPLLALAPLGLLVFGITARRRSLRALAGLLVLITLGITSTGCGDKYPDHTEPGSYSIQVTATSVPGTTPVPMTRIATFTLVVTP